jgi:hypothetical protein
MHHPHVSSGGRYPALRAIAVLYLVGSLLVVGLCVWQAVRVLMGDGDETTHALIGPINTTSGRVMAAVCWVAGGFIGLLGMLAIAELIKLFIDIEHNTRSLAAVRAPAAAADGAAATAMNGGVRDGPAIPFVRDRKLLDGEETAEGALLRGH